MNETIRLLARRRSLAPANLTEPGPSAAEVETLLTIASRVPDHGKLAPWRFIVFEGEARERAGRIALQIKLADDRTLAEAARSAELTRFTLAPLVVAVVSRAAPHVKNSGVGAGLVGGGGLHESDCRRQCARLCDDLVDRLVRI